MLPGELLARGPYTVRGCDDVPQRRDELLAHDTRLVPVADLIHRGLIAHGRQGAGAFGTG